MWSMAVHAVLILVQLSYLAFTVIAPLLGTPAAVYFGVLVVGIWTNKRVCNALLNFGDKVHFAGREYSKYPAGHLKDSTHERMKLQPAKYPGERWVFVNGVAAG